MINKKSLGDTISSFIYTYDNAGNRLSKIYANNDTEIYTYDDIYQLIKVETKDNVTEYEYDKVGNRIKMQKVTTDDTEITEYKYNTDNQLLYYTVNGINTVSFTYDANGNQLTKTTNDDTKYCIYDNENNLITIYYANDTNVITYMYSPDGKRLRKYENGVGRKYFYEGYNVLTEYDTNTTVQVRYTNNLKIDDIISAKRSGISEWYHKDALGSVINLTLNSQTISQSYKYDVFGTIIEQSGTSQNEMTYTGRRLDKLSGLYYYRSRYYNSAFGRFTQKDKYYEELLIDEKADEEKIRNILPLYVYVRNNAVRYKDYFGYAAACSTKCPEKCGGDVVKVSCCSHCYVKCWCEKSKSGWYPVQYIECW
jgi:RHS repeat-associated protein